MSRFCCVGADEATSVLDGGGAPLFGGETQEFTVPGAFWTGLGGGTGSSGNGSVFPTVAAGKALPPGKNRHTAENLTLKQQLRPF